VLVDAIPQSLPDRCARLDSSEFRRVLAAFTTGVTVITTMRGERASGVTANAFSSVSLEPPLVLVCVKRSGRACRDVAANRRFAVNILSAGQAALSVHFASRGRPRGRDAFRGVPHRIGAGGSPILDGIAAYLDCRLMAAHPAGDHVIFVGEVRDMGRGADVEPLLFHRGRYLNLT
jgi:flavin reductase (DIM6/NTAB) family NADH-FMN oxidoreductase RutF